MNNEEDEHETNKNFQNEDEEVEDNKHNHKKAQQQQQQQQQQLNNTKSNKSNLLTKWQTIINSIRKPIIQTLQTLSGQAATHPILTISIIITISLSFIIIGFMTNFRIEVDSDKLWVPQDSRGAKFIQWVESNDESGFPDEPVTVGILVYAEEDDDDGEEEEGKTARSVLDLEGMEKVFDVVDFMKSVEGYYDICPEDEEEEKKNDCNWRCATEIWSSRSEFETSIKTDEDLINALSSPVYADGKPIYRPRVFGTPDPIIRDVVERTNNGNYTLDDIRLTSAKSYLCALSIPTDPDLDQNDQPTYELEKLFIDGLRKMDEEWTDEGSDYHVRVFSGRSFDDEFNRSIQRDIPLMVIAFVIMGNFCSFFFFRCKDRVNSQSMVGLGAVVSVLLALMTCYGFMFCIGVPFTSLTQIFPFIMVGIGLDDAFIIMGYFTRTDQRNNNGNNNVVDRVSQMIEEAGMSITVSTFTTFLAFMLSSMNSIPAVRWFCYYAAPCIIIDFIYAITFFVAVLVLDDRRIKSRRWDAACCIKSKQQEEEEEQEELEEEEEEPKREEAIAEKVMDIYAKILLKPVTKVIVLVVFATTFVLLSIAASRLTQAFNFMDLTPKDSYVDQYFDALDETATGDSDGMLWISVYFRDVDFSTNETQDAMYSYLSDLQDLHFVTYPPSHFWLDDFKTFLSNNNTSSNTTLQTSPFNTQIDTFLSTPPYNELYSDHIVRDTQTGTITASRTFITFDQIDRLEVEQQMNAFIDQEQVGQNQRINQNRNDDWAFFTVGPIYGLWEFYSIIVGELTLSTILGIVSVFIISLLFIPHPVGSLVVTPTVMMIYIELLGVLHIAGLHINSVTSIALVMAIGLVVDYSMHIVFTFFEVHGIDRNEKVRMVLKTMGMSVMVGGFTTFLGVLPLSFSQSEIFWTFFVSFLGIVSLGVGHGLVFVPVVLSLVGPMYSVKKNKEEEEEDDNDDGDDEGDEED